MTTSRLSDIAAVVLAVALSLLAVRVGVHEGYRTVDTDEAVYRATLLRMRAGEGYYSAMRDSLVKGKHERPTQLRSIRPPTMFLALRWLPPSTWRWVVGAVYLAMTLLAWRIGRPYGVIGGPLACAAVGVWVLGFSNLLFLHSELWAAPLFMAGVLSARSNRDTTAAAFIGAATVVRELFGLGLVIGLVLAKKRKPWMLAIVIVATLAVVHALLASHVLSARGYEASFGNEARTATFLRILVSPGGAPADFVFGAVTIVAGVIGTARARRADVAARLVLPFSVVMLLLTVWSTRRYWSPVWAPPLACFVPAALLPPPWSVGRRG
jgi:hypothetical protein